MWLCPSKEDFEEIEVWLDEEPEIVTSINEDCRHQGIIAALLARPLSQERDNG